MPWHTIKDRVKISAIVSHLISHQKEIRGYSDGEKQAFRSRIVKFNHIRSEKREEKLIVIQGLDPTQGNELIHLSSEVRIELTIKKKFCRCKTTCLGSVN